MIRLGVNIDHVATLRQARRGHIPDPVAAAAACEASGADSIVVHLREDRRHIQDADVRALRRAIRTRLNLEMAAAEPIIRVACAVKPDQATLVPERRKELTTEGGLDVAANIKKIAAAVERLRSNGISVSLFIDPRKRQIDAAALTGASTVEFHTGAYARATAETSAAARLKELRDAAVYAAANKNLVVAAGHGLDYRNVRAVASIPQIEELNIGYSIVCRAVFTGLGRAVAEMKELLDE